MVLTTKQRLNILVNVAECEEAMPRCVECSAYNLCTECVQYFVVSATGDTCIGKV